jgi:hypothetical protein
MFWTMKKFFLSSATALPCLLLPLLNFSFNTLLEFDPIQPPAYPWDSSARQIPPKKAGIDGLNMAT